MRWSFQSDEDESVNDLFEFLQQIDTLADQLQVYSKHSYFN